MEISEVQVFEGAVAKKLEVAKETLEKSWDDVLVKLDASREALMKEQADFEQVIQTLRNSRK